MKGLGAPGPPRLAAPGRVLGPLSRRSSSLRAANSRRRGAATAAAAARPAPPGLPARARCPRWAAGPGAQQPHVAAPGAPRSAQGPGAPGPARPRAPRRMIFAKKVLMANLVFILKLLTMIFLG